MQVEQIIEGSTKILVPLETIKSNTPTKEPIFFNPKAKVNRDFSILLYSAFLENFKGPKIFLEGLSGIGARGIRVANEIKNIEKVIINDLNPSSLKLALRSTEINQIKNFEISENEVCRFFSLFSKKGNRGTIVDIDPFGSPAKYIDCGLRATMHGGMFSCTATDLQVLHGLFNPACKRRYGGVPIKTHYSNEIALRLLLGCIRTIAGRLDVEVIPQFVETEMHYYRTYLKIKNRPDPSENIGYIFHCYSCGNRGTSLNIESNCCLCNSTLKHGGPLWIGNLFDKNLIKEVLNQIKNFSVDKSCEKKLQKCFLEADLPSTYFTLDEIASKMKKSPEKLDEAIKKLKDGGYVASPTCLNPTGFRTNAKISEIQSIFSG